MTSYRFWSISSNTRASRPVGWSYKTSSRVMIWGWGDKRRRAWISRNVFTWSMLSKWFRIHLIAWYEPRFTFWALSTSEKVPSPFLDTSLYLRMGVTSSQLGDFVACRSARVRRSSFHQSLPQVSACRVPVVNASANAYFWECSLDLAGRNRWNSPSRLQYCSVFVWETPHTRGEGLIDELSDLDRDH